MRESKRMILLTDDDIDRILAWYAESHSRGDADLDDEDEDVAERLREVRLK